MPEPPRYVYIACKSCRKLRMVYRGPADLARKEFRKHSMNGEVTFFETVYWSSKCTCLKS